MKVDSKDLEWLREQPEWDNVVAYLRKRLFEVQEAMVRDGIEEVDMLRLNAWGSLLSDLLMWATKKREEE